MEDFKCCLSNCYISSREGDSALFFADGDKIYCNLDGYTIIPNEEYESKEKLKKKRVLILGGE